MANVQRSSIERDDDPLPHLLALDHHYNAGRPIGELQADVAQRLINQGAAQATLADTPGERAIRLFSMAGGYSALLAGYGVVALAIAHWV